MPIPKYCGAVVDLVGHVPLTASDNLVVDVPIQILQRQQQIFSIRGHS